jgi:DNA topoisomerase VI subunit A
LNFWNISGHACADIASGDELTGHVISTLGIVAAEEARRLSCKAAGTKSINIKPDSRDISFSSTENETICE